MSSVDPIFFLHHGNLDRLWDVWTRRQTALGRPALPQAADLTAWSDEQFLFFSNAQGQPVTTTKAGDYASMSAFDYDYSVGSGEEFVPGPAVASGQAFAAQITAATVGGAQPAGGVVQVPSSALQLPAVEAPTALVAEVTLNLGHNDDGRRFNVLVSTPGGGPQVRAGAITVFGHPHGGPTTFVVPLPELRASRGGWNRRERAARRPGRADRAHRSGIGGVRGRQGAERASGRRSASGRRHHGASELIRCRG